MQFTTITLIFASTGLLSTVFADNCYGTGNWCGSALLKKGDYQSTIKDKLAGASQPTDDLHVRESLFTCVADSKGDITFVSFCASGCTEQSGKANSDFCSGGTKMLVRGSSEARNAWEEIDA